MGKAALVLALVFMAGYATQRGSTCAVSAAQEIVEQRRATRLAGFLLCAFVSLGLMGIAHLSGMAFGQTIGEAPFAATTLLGGALFGAGAYINGRCAFGTIAKLGSGELARIGTLLGFLGGSMIAAFASMGTGVAASSLPLFTLAPSIMVITALIGFGAMTAIVRNGPTSVNAGWSTQKAMIVIGLANGALLLLAQGWSYTSLLMAVARGKVEAPACHGLIVATLIIGAITGAVKGKTFQFDTGTIRQWLATLGGGALMGLGAAFIPGGNDRMLMLGFPMLLPNLIAAYVAMMLALVLMIIVIGKRQTQ